jgi:Zn-dependent M28 family amino/carboxypeptidase
MTYYGRYSYKFEIASAKGAAAAIVIHETGPAGYPYSAVAATWTGEHLDLKGGQTGASRVAVEGWLRVDRAIELFAAAGTDFFLTKQRAARRDFAPVRLGLRASFDVKTTIREFTSRNVVARLEGSDPRLKDECVAYTAHWDHLGRDSSIAGDQIFNGAIDNASGVAGLLELAEAFATMKPAPPRSILFLATTAEEFGLVGARYYAQAPLFPLARTLAVVNIDGLNPWGRTKSVVSIGHGQSTLDDVLALAAAALGRTVVPDLEREKGMFYRSDQVEFAKRGVPAVFTAWTGDILGKPPGYGDEKGRAFAQRDYHRPTDDVKPDWDLAGAVEDLRLLFDVGSRVAADAAYPAWRPTSEFKRARDR